DLLLRTLQRPLPREAVGDLLDLLRDPSIDPANQLEILDHMVPPRRAGERPGEFFPLLVRRALARSRAGIAIRDDLERALASIPNARDRERAGDFQLEPGLLECAALRERARKAPDDAKAHARLLSLWATVNFDFEATEDRATEAHSI